MAGMTELAVLIAIAAAKWLLWLPVFIVAYGALLVLGYGFFRRVVGDEATAAYFKNNFRAGSKKIACLFTGDDRYSFSAQCGARAPHSVPWSVAATVVDFFMGKGHTKEAAEKEKPEL